MQTPIDIDELLNWCHVSAQEIFSVVLKLEQASLAQYLYGDVIKRD